MKKKYHHLVKGHPNKRLYTLPLTWVTANFMRESLLVESEELKTTIKDGYADSDGRGNSWSGFDDSEQSSASSLWDD
jgi:hypothetical protein